MTTPQPPQSMKTCRKCANAIPMAAKRCQYCQDEPPTPADMVVKFFAVIALSLIFIFALLVVLGTFKVR